MKVNVCLKGLELEKEDLNETIKKLNLESNMRES